ncbi:LDL receptor domain-containing protein [Candidatus Woesearchaeota archaeon]|nr:LDL receptor domain-containing protein [Candidatus Woesearchaeota archaeon]
MGLKQKLITLSLLTGLVGIPKSAEGYSTKTIHPGLVPKLIEFYKQTHETALNFDTEEIKKGTINEDSPDYAYIRAFNHFQHWQNGEGILNFSPIGDWAQNSEAQSTLISFAKLPSKIRSLLGCDSSLSPSECKIGYPFGDHSWETVKSEFVNGKIERSFGHVFHLIADTTVPAHVRNDPHWGDAPFLEKILARYYSEGAALWPSDVYEVWTNEHSAELLSQINPQEIPAVDNLSDLFDELSYFTGSNFYSDGAVDGTVGGLSEIQEGNKKYLVKTVEGKQVHVLRKGFFIDFPDVACLQDAWTVLGTKSVEYGAAAVEILINETASGCVDKCDYVGQKECAGETEWKECGDYNNDGCLELSGEFFCNLDGTSNKYCSQGECVTTSCTLEEWQCTDGACIPIAWHCDGGNDCNGGDDESGCGCVGTNECVYDGAKACTSDFKGRKECGDFNSDGCLEWGKYHTCEADEECSWGKCVSLCDLTDYWQCDNGICIPDSLLCDKEKDCSGGEDEDGCCKQDTDYCGEYSCINGKCTDCYVDAPNECINEGNYWAIYSVDSCGNQLSKFPIESCTLQSYCSNGECISKTVNCSSDADCDLDDICKESVGKCFPAPAPLCTGGSCIPVGIYVYDNGSETDDSFGLEIKDAFYGETPSGGGNEWTIPMVDGQTYEMLLYGVGVPDGIGTYAIELTNAVKVDGPSLSGSDLDDGISFTWHIKAKK